MENLKG